MVADKVREVERALGLMEREVAEDAALGGAFQLVVALADLTQSNAEAGQTAARSILARLDASLVRVSETVRVVRPRRNEAALKLRRSRR